MHKANQIKDPILYVIARGNWQPELHVPALSNQIHNNHYRKTQI